MPALQSCLICQQAKQKRAAARATKPEEKTRASKFGELVQADHISQLATEATGLHGERVSLHISDEGTGFKGAFPSIKKDEVSCIAAFKSFAGAQLASVKVVRTDNAPELIAALRSFTKVIHNKTIPHSHETHSRRERDR